MTSHLTLKRLIGVILYLSWMFVPSWRAPWPGSTGPPPLQTSWSVPLSSGTCGRWSGDTRAQSWASSSSTSRSSAGESTPTSASAGCMSQRPGSNRSQINTSTCKTSGWVSQWRNLLPPMWRIWSLNPTEMIISSQDFLEKDYRGYHWGNEWYANNHLFVEPLDMTGNLTAASVATSGITSCPSARGSGSQKMCFSMVMWSTRAAETFHTCRCAVSRLYNSW